MAGKMKVPERAVQGEGGRQADFSSSLAALLRLSCSGRAQRDSGSLQMAEFGIFVSSPQVWHPGWKSWREDATLNGARNLGGAGAAASTFPAAELGPALPKVAAGSGVSVPA